MGRFSHLLLITFLKSISSWYSRVVPGTGLPCGVTQCGEAAGNFHDQEFLVSDRGGPGGN